MADFAYTFSLEYKPSSISFLCASFAEKPLAYNSKSLFTNTAFSSSITISALLFIRTFLYPTGAL